MKKMMPLAFAAYFAATVHATEADKSMTVIEVRQGSGNKTLYSVDGRPVNLIQLKDQLSIKLTGEPKSKSSTRIAILAYPEVRLGVLTDLKGLILKIGHNNPRYFLTYSPNGNLSEVNVNYRPVFHRSELESVMNSE